MRLFILSACALLGACSGAPLDAGADAAVGPRPGDCPAALPPQGSACPRAGLLCEYGSDFNPLCNAVVVCSGGTWASPIFQTDRPQCPTVIPTPVPNPNDCAGTRAAVPEGQTCSSKSTCTYEGASCSCGVFCPSFPLQMPPCDTDAGVTMNCCDMTKVQWHCFDGPAWCTRPRPSLGVACAKEGQECAVSGPVECGQNILRCEMGTWQVANSTCPISTARAKRDITYLDDEQAERLRRELLGVHLATYRYRSGDDAPHLGFIIEDMPPTSPAVLPSRERVDLYGYVSMAVATLQQQEKELAALRAEVSRLKNRRR